jgi:hypothetical protein
VLRATLLYEARKVSKQVSRILGDNEWFGFPAAEIRHASDWNGEKP